MIFDPTTPTRHIRKRLMISLHQDGLFDILGGLIVITFGLIPLLDEMSLGLMLRQVIILSLYGLEVGAVLILKNRVTLPRTGLVVLARKKSRNISLILLLVNVLIFLLIIAILIFDLKIGDRFGQYQLSIILGLVFMILLTVSGAMLHAMRYYVYGITVFICFLWSEHLFWEGKTIHHGIPLAAMISGGIMILAGSFLLRKFIGKYKIENQ